jgi:N-methylhydantoinase A
MLLGSVDALDPATLESEFEALEAEAAERMRAEGVPEDQVSLQRTVDMRYAGQWRSIAVPVEGRVGSLADLVRTFEDEHEREHSYRREGSAVEVYRLNLRATGATQKAELARHEIGEAPLPAPIATRAIRFAGEPEALDSPVYRRSELPAGAELTGPAVIEQLDSTVLVPPDVTARVDEWLNIRMTLEGPPA